LPSFDDFGLLRPIRDAIATEGYTSPTPIQAQAVPHIMTGRDLCGIAQTGTGKTAAFALPILHRLASQPGSARRGGCRVLVLSPTRELASQIADNFCSYGRNLSVSTTVVFGGVPIGAQQRRLALGVDILVATPGRLLDLADRRAVSLSMVEILVLDEADRMLDLGFIHALERIAKLLPSRRQTLLFSATMPRTITALAETYLVNPVRVSVAPAATTVECVDQSVLFVSSERKRELLTMLLRDPSYRRVLVFTRTKHGADRVVRHLIAAGLDAAAIHGNKSQPQRERALAGFRSGDGRVLVATDIAARGIDVEGVSHVINFELPNVPEDYVHRIGRTARAGAPGTAIAFCSDEERPYLRSIEKLTRLSIAVSRLPSALRDARAHAAGHSEAAQPRRLAGVKAEHWPLAPGRAGERERAHTDTPSLPAFLQHHPAASARHAVPSHRPGRRARRHAVK